MFSKIINRIIKIMKKIMKRMKKSWLSLNSNCKNNIIERLLNYNMMLRKELKRILETILSNNNHNIKLINNYRNKK
jgi:hypothetical protein